MENIFDDLINELNAAGLTGGKSPEAIDVDIPLSDGYKATIVSISSDDMRMINDLRSLLSNPTLDDYALFILHLSHVVNRKLQEQADKALKDLFDKHIHAFQECRSEEEVDALLRKLVEEEVK